MSVKLDLRSNYLPQQQLRDSTSFKCGSLRCGHSENIYYYKNMMQAPPMEKLSFSYMDDDGLNESLLHVPQSDYGLNTGEMTIPEQADEVLSRCNL